MQASNKQGTKEELSPEIDDSAIDSTDGGDGEIDSDGGDGELVGDDELIEIAKQEKRPPVEVVEAKPLSAIDIFNNLKADNENSKESIFVYRLTNYETDGR
ncbi:hypothetical protein ABGS62_15405, partial [Lactiplantibacillus plantarum]|uniref:hypothetical protein n=1 Tax=Lactiplantibacillus plantarum TaxID=1590 RepID=UPI00325D3D5C